MPRKRSTTEQCLFRHKEGGRCDNESRTRGLCCSHYSTARQLVEKRKTTWKKLLAAGLCKEPRFVQGVSASFLAATATAATATATTGRRTKKSKEVTEDKAAS